MILRSRVREQLFSMQTITVYLMSTIFFNIKFTYFRICVFFREWRKPRAKHVIFVSLISTILFLYFYLLTYPRLFFSWIEKAMSSACQTQLVVVPIEQQFINEWSLTLARKICSDSVNHTPSCGNQNIRL